MIDPDVPVRKLLQEELLRAAVWGDVAEVEAILAEGADPDGTAAPSFWLTALKAAAYRGREQVVRYLLEAGANVDAVSGALFYTIWGGREKVARILMAAGADVDINLGGYTPLIIAAAQDRANLAELLVRHGANVNARDPRGGWTALTMAASRGNSRTVRLLIEAGADVNVEVHVPRANMLERWAAPDALAGAAHTALAHAARYGRLQTVRLLLSAGAKQNTCNIVGWTALHQAADGGHADVVRALLEAGADPKARDFAGRTARMLASGPREEKGKGQ